jgi:signal transduction histidine kinase/CheY-like chemotaxis protein
MIPRSGRATRLGPVALVAAVCLLATGLAWRISVAVGRNQDLSRFQSRVTRAASRLRASLDQPLALLRGAQGLFAASQHVSADEWHGFVSRVYDGGTPGLQALAFIESDSSDVEVRSARLSFIEPSALSARIGQDLAGLPGLRAALWRARGANSRCVSQVNDDIFLPPEIRELAVVAPVGGPGARQSGWVAAILRADELLGEALRPVASGLYIEVFDGASQGGRPLGALGAPPGDHDGFDESATIVLPGRLWTLRVRTRPEFLMDGDERIPYEVAGGGLLATVIVTGIVGWVTRGRAAAVVLSGRLREKEAETQRALEAAEAASVAKGRFLTMVSHELRTPMAAILGHAELLTDQTLSPAERSESARTIRRNGEHLLRMINDILDLSKIEAGSMEAERLPCSPVRVVEDVVSLLRVRARPKGLELNAAYAFPLPRAVRTDPVRLRQVLMNIVGNAVKFTRAGRIDVGVRRRGDELAIEVRDTGIGISPEQMGRLFKPFAQADSSTTRRFGGTGLGLAISDRLARVLGGRLAVRSVPGEGSVFTLTIPCDDAGDGQISTVDEALREPDPAEHALDDSELHLSGRVLLAEDGVDNQRLLTFWLTRAGAQVDLARDGREAVEKVCLALNQARDARHYDLILMDMQMPELDGVGATLKIRGHGFRGPIVALTAQSDADERERMLGAGCDDFLAKPVPRERLLRTCKAWILRAEGEPHLAA